MLAFSGFSCHRNTIFDHTSNKQQLQTVVPASKYLQLYIINIGGKVNIDLPVKDWTSIGITQGSPLRNDEEIICGTPRHS